MTTILPPDATSIANSASLPPPLHAQDPENGGAEMPAEGQLARPASEHDSLRSSVEEERATGNQPPTGPRRQSLDRPVVISGRYQFGDLEYERGQPSELEVNPDQSGYFESLVAKTLETDTLPTVRPNARWRSSDASPLYPLTPGQSQVTSQDLNGGHGTTLALDLALRLQMYHTKAQIRQEMAKVVAAASTTDADLDRMRELLSQLNSYSKLHNALRYSYRDVIKQRLAAGNLFPRDPDEQPASRRSRSRSRANDSNDETNGERVQTLPRPHVAFAEKIRSILAPSNGPRRDSSVLSSRGVHADPLSASEHGEATAADTAPDEKRRGKRKRVLDTMVNIGLGVVLIIAFVPMLLYGLFKRGDGDGAHGRENERSKFSRRESFMRRDRRHEYDRRKGFPTRLLAAFVGGLSLVVPMLIMSLDPSLTKSLITTSVFIFVFGVMMAWRTSMEPHNVLTATATYAAVLVVFTGVSN